MSDHVTTISVSQLPDALNSAGSDHPGATAGLTAGRTEQSCTSAVFDGGEMTAKAKRIKK